MATQLEVVAAELANATAQLAQIDRLYADVEACGVESLWDDISHDEHEDTCAQIEREREEARAVYERKLGAMEAALAARERSRKQITNALKDTNVFVSETKSRLPLDEKNTTMAPPKGKISTDMAPQTPFASPLSRPLPSTPCGNGRELILQGFNWESCDEGDRNGKSWYQVLNERKADIAGRVSRRCGCRLRRNPSVDKDICPRICTI